jgi:hypothetical protein
MDGPIFAQAGGLVVQGSVSQIQSGITPLFRVDSRGKVKLITKGDKAVNQTGSADFIIAEGDRQTTWRVENASNYKIQQFDSAGNVLRSFLHATPTDWGMRALSSREALDSLIRDKGPGQNITSLLLQRPKRPLMRPFARFSGLYSTADRLFVSYRIASPDWRTVDLEYTSDGRRSETSDVKLYRTVLDVIDIGTGRVTHRAFMPGMGAILNDGTFSRAYYDDTGVVRLEVFQPLLVTSKAKGGLQ